MSIALTFFSSAVRFLAGGDGHGSMAEKRPWMRGGMRLVLALAIVSAAAGLVLPHGAYAGTGSPADSDDRNAEAALEVASFGVILSERAMTAAEGRRKNERPASGIAASGSSRKPAMGHEQFAYRPEPSLSAFGVDRALDGMPVPLIGEAVPLQNSFEAGQDILPAGAFYPVAVAVGLPEPLVDELVNIFSGEVDFHKELRAGYGCTVLFESRYEGAMLVPGRILAVRLTTPERTHTAYLFPDYPAFHGYYNSEGRPLRNTLLRSPILFSRTTSAYSVNRLHPILNLWRAHYGVDYAAPTGTPVRVTGEGVVEFAGKRGNYGNLVVVLHRNSLSTYYGHLESISPGIRPGELVRQGDVIGVVGTTGLSTGPHLHYEVRKLDRPMDPALFHSSYLQSLPAALRGRFEEKVERYDRQLATAIRTHLIRID